VSVKANILIGGLLAVAEIAFAQTSSKWRVHRALDGLAESACLSVTYTRPGRVLTRHFNLPVLDELDGYSVTNHPAPEGANGRFYGFSSGQVWTAVPEGLQEWRDGRWELHAVPEIAAEYYQGMFKVIDPVPLVPVRHGAVLFLTRSGLMMYDATGRRSTMVRSSAESAVGKFSGLALAQDGGLWICGERGLIRSEVSARDLKPGGIWRRSIAPETLGVRSFQQPLEDVEGGVTMVAEDSAGKLCAVVRFDGGDVWTSRILPCERLRFAWLGPDRVWRAVTLNTLYTWRSPDGKVVESDEISPRQIFDVALEPGGAFWLATSEGLYRWAPAIWQVFQAADGVGGPVQAFAADTQGGLWILCEEGLSSFRGGVFRNYPLPESWRRSLGLARNFQVLKNGTLVIDAGGRLLEYQAESGASSTRGGGEQDRYRLLGMVQDGALWVQRSRAEGSVALERYDGDRWEQVPGLPAPGFSTNYHCVIGARGGDVWLGADEGAAWYHQGTWKLFRARDGSGPESPQRLLEISGGRIWAASNDQLWEFDGREWRSIRQGVDRITALRTKNGKLPTTDEK